MTDYCIARMNHRGHLRFFAGRYSTRGPIPLPVSTGNPDAAKSYGDTAVAKFVCTFLNVTAGSDFAQSSVPWAVMPLPETRK